MSLILFFSIPLSYVFVNIKPIYFIWSTAGVSIVSTIIFSFVVLFDILKDKVKKEFYYSIPVSYMNMVSSFYIFSILISFFQFSFSILLINSINGYFLSFLDCFLIYLLLIPSILIVASLSILSSFFIKEKIIFVSFTLFLFIVCSFGFGAFFPLSIYPDIYYKIVKYFPLTSTVLNIQRIISAQNIYFSFLIVSFIYAIFFMSLSIATFSYNIKERKF